MPKYTVKSLIQRGEGERDPETKKAPVVDYFPGDQIELTEDEAFEIRHALEDPPQQFRREPSAFPRRSRAKDDTRDDLEEGEEEALESIRNRPDNPDSGVQLHFQTDLAARKAYASGQTAAQLRTVETGHGFERANVGGAGAERADYGGLGGPLPGRPDTNKTVMERNDEETIQEAEEQSAEKAARRMAAQPAVASPSKPAGPKASDGEKKDEKK